MSIPDETVAKMMETECQSLAMTASRGRSDSGTSRWLGVESQSSRWRFSLSRHRLKSSNTELLKPDVNQTDSSDRRLLLLLPLPHQGGRVEIEAVAVLGPLADS